MEVVEAFHTTDEEMEITEAKVVEVLFVKHPYKVVIVYDEGGCVFNTGHVGSFGYSSAKRVPGLQIVVNHLLKYIFSLKSIFEMEDIPIIGIEESVSTMVFPKFSQYTRKGIRQEANFVRECFLVNDFFLDGAFDVFCYTI